MRAAVTAAVLALTCATGAAAHEGDSHSGFASRVSVIDPFIPGLLVQVVGGHERVSIANLTEKSVVVLDAGGRPLVRIRAGETRVWDEPRVGADEEPPDREGLVRNWVIRGTANGEPFAIRGFLGYRPPVGAGDADDGSALPVWVLALALPAVLVPLGALLLARRPRQ